MPFAIKYFANYYWETMSERFDLKERPTDLDNPDEIVAVMEAIGRKRGCIVSGGRVDLEKASSLFLRELRAGSLGDTPWNRLIDSLKGECNASPLH